MNSIRKMALACMTGAMMITSVNAGAQGLANQDTYFTFSQPVELPKTTLPAGKYFFQLMDSTSNRHIVKVMSEDRKQLLATIMAIPYHSNDRPSDEPQVRFLETRAADGAAPSNAIKIWFYPGTSTGHEFIWPRNRAMTLAKASGETVLTTKTEAEDSELSRINAAGTDSEANLTAQASPENAAAQPTQEPAPVREPVGAITGGRTEPAPAPAPEPEPADRTDLPATAGLLPLLALIGAASLAGSRMLRRARQ
jgi:hypothetical protein